MNYRKEQQRARDLKRAWIDLEETEEEFEAYDEDREVTEFAVESLFSNKS